MQDLMSRWRDTSLFVGVSDETLEKILQVATPAVYNKGDIIIKEMDTGNDFYMILSGKVIIRKSQEGNPPDRNITELHGDETLQHQYEGDFFGEMSLLDFAPRSATVLAGDQVQILVISGEQMVHILNEKLRDHVAFLGNVSRILSRRLRHTTKKLSA